MAADCVHADESFDSIAVEETAAAVVVAAVDGGVGDGADGRLGQTALNVAGESEAVVRWPGVSCL